MEPCRGDRYGHEEAGDVVIDKKLKDPDRYAVLLHNDDYTSMDFVVGVICSVFHKTLEQAAAIMMRVHKQGVGQCGIFTREIAEAKVQQVHCKAQEAGFPLKCTMEKI
ncbi:MAG: ATP-dependent Clp protease adaptor ClpS [Desulfovibrio sp.]|jgi:ATP-dependent Clp protease adaptor protein ClpS|nr:ATP-dependent Clp protease adaptor ClpS [Desulfovibrio sp.]